MSRFRRGAFRHGRLPAGPAMPQWLITRRRALMLTGAASVLPLLGNALSAKPGPGRKFFTSAEFSILERVADLIIPTDEVSGGAREAKVAQVIDARIGESLEPAMQQEWRAHLAEIDRLSKAWFGRPFMQASERQCVRLLERISRNEDNPKKGGEIAFGIIKWEVCNIYYRTSIGIHDDLGYQGNQILDEFAGTDVANRPALPDRRNPPKVVDQ